MLYIRIWLLVTYRCEASLLQAFSSSLRQLVTAALCSLPRLFNMFFFVIYECDSVFFLLKAGSVIAYHEFILTNFLSSEFFV